MSEWKLVPAEPTEAMFNAAEAADDKAYDAGTWTNAADHWRAMLAAAPSPWRPISEAPKDGTPFIGYLGGLKVPFFVCWWATSIRHGNPVICVLGIGELFDVKLTPTHFISLPPAPVATSARSASPAIDVAQTPQTPASEARNRPSGDCEAEGAGQ